MIKKLVYKGSIHFGLTTLRQAKIMLKTALFRSGQTRQILARKGACKRCGKCCPGCKWLVQIGKGRTRCREYHSRPCFPFPLNQKERDEINPNCGYYWEVE